MKWTLSVGWALALSCCLMGSDARALEILTPGDAILAIDTDPPASNSSFPAGEAPSFAVDGTPAKYLNFGGAGSGFIVTPAAGASTVQSIRLTTANDSEGRDPASLQLWGTNETIVSADNSDGLGEPWTFIGDVALTGALALPPDRETLGPVVPIANGDAYASYKLLFPDVKGSTLFQLGEASFFETSDGMGGNVLSSGDPILAVHFGPDSKFPGAEGPGNLLDADAETKYLNFGRENSGFIVTPAAGPSTVKTFQITTANDSESRDPTTWELYGTNDDVASMQNSQGDGESWTLIESGSIELPAERLTPGPFVQIENDTEYASYRMVFPTIRDPAAMDADSLQIGGVQFFSVTIPEPASCALGAVALLASLATARRRGLKA